MLLLFGGWALGVAILAPLAAYVTGRLGVATDIEKNLFPHVAVLVWPLAPFLLVFWVLARVAIVLLDSLVPQLTRLHELGKEHSKPRPAPPPPEPVPGSHYRDGGR